MVFCKLGQFQCQRYSMNCSTVINEGSGEGDAFYILLLRNAEAA